MIYQGSKGSINGFYKGKLIVSRPLTEKLTYKEYKVQADRTIIEGLREGYDIEFIKKSARRLLKLTRYENMINEPTKEDLNLILLSLFMLIKFREVEEDGEREGILVCGRKKPKKIRKKELF
jgi:hypothetical protein